jgi:hypothetical protein
MTTIDSCLSYRKRGWGAEQDDKKALLVQMDEGFRIIERSSDRAFADTQQHRAPAAGPMAWHQSEIGLQFAPASKLGGVTDRRDQGGCGHRTHAFHRSHTLAAFVLAEQPVDG